MAEADNIVVAQPEASALHQLARSGEVADQTQHLMAAHRENGCIFIQHGVGLTRFHRRETVRRGKHVRHRGAELGRNVRQDLGQKLEVFFVKRHHKVRLLWESCSYPLQDGAIFVWKKVPQRDERNVQCEIISRIPNSCRKYKNFRVKEKFLKKTLAFGKEYAIIPNVPYI